MSDYTTEAGRVEDMEGAPRPPALHPDSTVRFVCDRCRQPAIQRDGKWEHAEAADAAFCQLVMRAGE